MSLMVIKGVTSCCRSIVQLPNLGDFNKLYTDKSLYNCKNVGVPGWSFAPAARRIVPKNFYKKNYTYNKSFIHTYFYTSKLS
jgi:hypothetical protein